MNISFIYIFNSMVAYLRPLVSFYLIRQSAGRERKTPKKSKKKSKNSQMNVHNSFVCVCMCLCRLYLRIIVCSRIYDR